MRISYLTAREADEIALSYVTRQKTDKITGIFFVRKNCGACEYMMNEVLPNVDIPVEVEIFKVDVDDETEVLYPPIRTPMAYFYIPNSKKIPIMREGVGPVDAIGIDLLKMVKVMNGADYYETFFPGKDKEHIPEHEK